MVTSKGIVRPKVKVWILALLHGSLELRIILKNCSLCLIVPNHLSGSEYDLFWLKSGCFGCRWQEVTFALFLRLDGFFLCRRCYLLLLLGCKRHSDELHPDVETTRTIYWTEETDSYKLVLFLLWSPPNFHPNNNFWLDNKPNLEVGFSWFYLGVNYSFKMWCWWFFFSTF